MPKHLLSSFTVCITVSFGIQCTAQAQIVPDGTTATQVRGTTIAPLGTGTVTNGNLYHSFTQLNVPQSGVIFSTGNSQVSGAAIANIFNRVTGNTPSSILGLIQSRSAFPNANIYLLNPNGIVFGANASLDIGGSFHASTGTGLTFSNGQIFSTNQDRIFPSGEPTNLRFSVKQPAAIINQGDLTVNDGSNLTLTGGTVISTGNLFAPNGKLGIAAVSGNSTVELRSPDAVLSLNVAAGAVAPEWQGTITEIPALASLLTGQMHEANRVIAKPDGSLELTTISGTINLANPIGSVAIAPNFSTNQLRGRTAKLEPEPPSGNTSPTTSTPNGQTSNPNSAPPSGNTPPTTSTSSGQTSNPNLAPSGNNPTTSSNGQTRDPDFAPSGNNPTNSPNGQNSNPNSASSGNNPTNSPSGQNSNPNPTPSGNNPTNSPNGQNGNPNFAPFSNNNPVETIRNVLTNILGSDPLSNTPIANISNGQLNNLVTNILSNPAIATNIANGQIGNLASKLLGNTAIANIANGQIGNLGSLPLGNIPLINISNGAIANLGALPLGNAPLPNLPNGQAGIIGSMPLGNLPPPPTGLPPLGNPPLPNARNGNPPPAGSPPLGNPPLPNARDGNPSPPPPGSIPVRVPNSASLPPNLNIAVSSFSSAVGRLLSQEKLPQAFDVLERGNLSQLESYLGKNLTTRALDLEDGQRQIAKSSELTGSVSALIYPVILSDRLEILVIPPTGSSFRRVVYNASAKVINSVIAEFKVELQDPSSNDYLAPAQKLYNWLIRPIEADLQARNITTLVFVMDGALRVIPPAAFHDGKQFLVEKYASASVPTLRLSNLEPRNRENNRILAMGLTDAVEGFTALPGVEIEVNTITTNPVLLGNGFLNQPFTVKNLQAQRQKQNYGIIHLATHADFLSNKADNAFIQFWDERLTINEIPSLRLDNPPIELLILSACKTAVGANLGISGVALESGVKSVMASLWAVSDAGTAPLMISFYSEFKGAASKAIALQKAQLSLLSGKVHIVDHQIVGLPNLPAISLPQTGTKTNLSHPFYWSSFILVGNWL